MKRFEELLALLRARVKWTRATTPPRTTSTSPPRQGNRGENVDNDDDDEEDDNDQPSTRGASGGAGVYILDLGGWKSEIAPYWAMRRGYGGAL